MYRIPSFGKGKNYIIDKDQIWVKLYCNSSWYHKLISSISIPNLTKKTFRKDVYRIQDTPFDLIEDFIQESNDGSCTLNFTLNLKYNYHDGNMLDDFAQKKPIYMKQKFDDENNHQTSKKIKQKFNKLCMSFITNIERTNNMHIPIVIAAIIKNYIKVGYAVFYCKDFEIA